MGFDRQKYYTTTAQLHDELEEAIEMRQRLKTQEFDEVMPEMITNETRIKLLKAFIDCFKYAKRTGNRPEVAHMSARCKLHFKQLRRLGTENYQDNVMFFVMLFKILWHIN